MLQLAEAVDQIQARIKGMLDQGWHSSALHKGLHPIQTGQQPLTQGSKSPFEGTAAPPHHPSQPARNGAHSGQSKPNDRLRSVSCVRITQGLCAWPVRCSTFVCEPCITGKAVMQESGVTAYL